MDKRYRRCACGLLAGVLLLLTAAAAVVYAVDPAFYYRVPADGEAVFFNERYQSAGLAANVEADTVLVGTSMAANYRPSAIGAAFGGSGGRITLPDGYISEFDRVMDVLFRKQAPGRVVIALDMNILTRDGSGVTDAMPEYLYNRNPVDDVRYLLNKDALYYSFFVLKNREWGTTETLDESFVWDEGIWWNHITALAGYARPEPSGETLPADAYLDNVRSNLAVVERWITEHPDTQFEIFLSPYSMLFWDKAARLGQTEAVLAAVELTCTALLGYENAALYGCLMDREFVDDLDNYCDHLHHSTEMGDRVLAKIAAGEGRLTEENVAQTLANWRTFVVDYDYEKFWDTAFWEEWNAARAKT
ncbi:MAG: hypothetical protein E7429_01195 [Ruminococcaceae bacterium]|nr:hypothetical protein [Oscillospiraceae bacterium]